MNDEEVGVFLGRLSTAFRSPYKDEEAGWREWLVTGFVELDLATETLESLSQQRHFPRLPAFRALYCEFHRVRDHQASRGRRYPKCDICGRRGMINYVRGGFSPAVTKPMHKDSPRNFPYMTDAQVTFCHCEKAKSLFDDARPDGDWQKHVDFVFQVALGGNMAVTGRFIDASRKLPPEEWEPWQNILVSFRDLPLADLPAPAEALEEIDL